MRTFKFRAWDGQHILQVTKLDYVKYGDKRDSISCEGYWGDNQKVWFSNTAPIQQFTGLKDKNGNDIYEGDILKIDGLVVPVEYKNGAFIVSYFSVPTQSPLGHFDETDIEIIGNIYENTELLNQ